MLVILRHKGELLQHTFVYQPVVQPAWWIKRLKVSPLQQTYIPPSGGMPIFRGCDQDKPWVRKLKRKMDSEPSLTIFSDSIGKWNSDADAQSYSTLI